MRVNYRESKCLVMSNETSENGIVSARIERCVWTEPLVSFELREKRNLPLQMEIRKNLHIGAITNHSEMQGTFFRCVFT